MSGTEFPANHPQVVPVLSKELNAEVFRLTYLSQFMGSDSNSLIQVKTELQKNAGDSILSGLRIRLQGDGVGGPSTLEGREEDMRFFTHSLKINKLRHAVKINGEISEQRVPWNLRMEGKDGLSDWFADRFDTTFANHACGYTPEKNPLYTGFNAVTAPTAHRILRPNGKSTDESLTAGDEFSLSLVDRAKIKAKTASTILGTGPLVRPMRIKGKEMYVMFVHDFQVDQLRSDDSSGKWLDVQKAALAGGDIEDNPIFTGALGVWNGVILHEWSRITNGVHSTDDVSVPDTRRAVLCGAQAIQLAFGGRNSSTTRFGWVEEPFDYRDKLGIAGETIFGMKKALYEPDDGSATNKEDFGTVVVSTYSPDPNA